MKEYLSDEYNRIFKKYEHKAFFTTLNDRGYTFQYDEDETECDLVFIGINPSYTSKHENGKAYQSHYERNIARSYFKPFGNIHDQLSAVLRREQYTNWTHLDLFVHRETNQNEIKKLISDPVGHEFIMENLEVAKKRLIHIAPKIIIISNTLAREFSGKNRSIDEKGNHHVIWMDLDFDNMDEEYGSFKVKNIPELAHTHFLFSSVLSGQRALDIGSRERLVWQVKRVMKS